METPTEPHHLQKPKTKTLNIINRTRNKGQPWRSPTCIEKELDFVPRMWTLLLLWLFQITLNSDPSTPYSLQHPWLSLPQSDLILQIHSTCVDCRTKLPGPTYQPYKNEGLVNCSTIRTKATLPLLNLRFNNRSEPPWSKLSW